MENTFKSSCICTTETSLQSVQYKLIYKYVAYNELLMKSSLKRSDCHLIGAVEHRLFKTILASIHSVVE